VRRLVPAGEGRFREEPPPARPPDDDVTLLDIYGSVFYAATEVIEKALPDVRGSHNAVMIFRLRGRGEVGSSSIGLLRRYAEDLQAGGGALLLAGVSATMTDQLRRTGLLDVLGEDSVFRAHDMVYESTDEAIAEGRRRLAGGAAPAP
jgi:SulP family sulfate permease